MTNLIGRIVALCAFMWLLPSVNERVDLQVTILTEGFVALRTVILFDPIVGQSMSPKATFAGKRLWALVTRFKILHR